MPKEIEHEAGAKIDVQAPGGIVHISCRKIQLLDDKLILDIDENLLFKMKTIEINMGKKTYTFKQVS